MRQVAPRQICLRTDWGAQIAHNRLVGSLAGGLVVQMPVVASIDLGSYTSRLLVARVREKSEIKPILRKRIYTRIGEDECFLKLGHLSHKAQRRVLESLRRLASHAREAGAKAINVAATGVIRKAKNRDMLVGLLKEKTGLEVTILTGREEAVLTAKGVMRALPGLKAPFVIFDLGGGSTEFFFKENHRSSAKILSLPIGAAVLTRQYLKHDPPHGLELRELEKVIRDELNELNCLFNKNPEQTIGTGGTVTSIAAMCRNLGLKEVCPELLNGTRLSTSQIEALFDRIRCLRSSERAVMPGLESNRADVIIAGAFCVLQILKCLHAPYLMVSLSDILEALVIQPIENTEIF